MNSISLERDNSWVGFHKSRLPRNARLLRMCGAVASIPLMTSAVSAQCASVPSLNLSEYFIPRTLASNGQANISNAPISNTVANSATGVASSISALISTLNTNNISFLSQTNAFIGAPGNPFPDQPGGGIWVRGAGGTFDTRVGSSYSVRYPYPDYAGLGGTAGCDVRTFLEYSGVQAGADISRLNIGGGNLHIGVTTGYTESSVRAPTGPAALTGLPGSLNATFHAPFIGAYAAFTKDTFYIDGQVRWDFIQGSLSNRDISLFNQNVDTRSLSVSGNIGRQFLLNDGWFVEPSAGLLYSEAKVDPFSVAGGIYLPAIGGSTPPTKVRIGEIDSLLARASLRVGKTVTLENVLVQPFITATLFNEFSGPIKSNISSDFLGFGSTYGNGDSFARYDSVAQLKNNRIGTYGQISLGVAGQLLNTGWLAYMRGDYRTGDHVDGWGISGGLRYQFTPEGLVARALVRKGYDPEPETRAVPGPVNWTGIHVGGSFGGTWGYARQSLTTSVAGQANPTVAGALVGGQLGADYQFGRIVVGIAGDYAWSNAQGGRACPVLNVGELFFSNCTSQLNAIGMATGRVGYALDRTLFYVRGGAAFADFNESIRAQTGTEYSTVRGGVLPSTSARGSAAGWTVGAGFEFMLTDHWSAKAEYAHYGLENRAIALPAAAAFGIVANSVKHEGDLVRVGLNYRFGSNPGVEATPASPVLAKR